MSVGYNVPLRITRKYTVPLKQRYSIALLTSAAIAFLIYFIIVLWSDYQETVQLVKTIPFSILALTLGLSLTNYLLRFFRWDAYIGLLSPLAISKLKHAFIYLAGFTLTTTPGKAGEALRSLYLKPLGIKYSHSLSVLFVERLMDLIIILAMSLLSLSYFDDKGIQYTAAAGGLLILVLLPLIREQAFWRFIRRLALPLPNRLVKALDNLINLIETSSSLLQKHNLYLGLLLGLVAWGLEGVGFYVILQTLNVECPLSLAIGIYAMSVLVGALSFLPGGLGTTEAAMIIMLIATGADKPSAVAATLTCRIVTLWFAIFIGALSIGGLSAKGVFPSHRND
jgi:uncharacterized protein (TIRG00374 family)